MKKHEPARVINVNKNGEIFDPASYVVRRADNPALYQFLEGSNGDYKTEADR